MSLVKISAQTSHCRTAIENEDAQFDLETVNIAAYVEHLPISPSRPIDDKAFDDANAVVPGSKAGKRSIGQLSSSESSSSIIVPAPAITINVPNSFGSGGISASASKRLKYVEPSSDNEHDDDCYDMIAFTNWVSANFPKRSRETVAWQNAIADVGANYNNFLLGQCMDNRGNS